MVGFAVVVGCVVVAAAALLPLRRALFVAAVMLVVLAYVARQVLDDGSLGALSPLSAACAFLVVLLIRRLAEQRRQARRLLAAERTAAVAQARAAADLERTRIARDLHDGLAHHLSGLLMQVQTAQAMLDDGDTQAALSTMGSSVELARQCLVESRDVVGALRSGLGDLQSLRNISDDWAQATGRRVRVRLPPHVVDLDGARWGAVMAALREALTNIARHTTSRDVAVEVSMSKTGLRLAVTDHQPDPTVTRAPGQGGGHGLIGLTERAALLQGTLHAGPHDNGWQLLLTLPPPRAHTQDDCDNRGPSTEKAGNDPRPRRR